MNGPQVDILMYHSIAEAEGPTSISPAVFTRQIEAIAEAGVPVITMDAYLAARQGRGQLAPHSVVITFDDGFQDFADNAWPVLSAHGYRPIVYLPTDYVGGHENWAGAHNPPRPLMGWDRIGQLAGEGVLFGSHSVTHPDLNALDGDVLVQELRISRQEIEDRLGGPVLHFAPPYGAAGAPVRHAVATQYETSVGTRLGRAGARSDLHDLPRLEMFYFRDIRRWRAHLAGRGGAYLAGRRVLRRVGQAVRRPRG